MRILLPLILYVASSKGSSQIRLIEELLFSAGEANKERENLGEVKLLGQEADVILDENYLQQYNEIRREDEVEEKKEEKIAIASVNAVGAVGTIETLGAYDSKISDYNNGIYPDGYDFDPHVKIHLPGWPPNSEYYFGIFVLLICFGLSSYTWALFYVYGSCVWFKLKPNFKITDIQWMKTETESKYVKLPGFKDIPRKLLSYDDEDCILGQGKYGRVLKGKFFNDSIPSVYQKVAVKKVNCRNPNAEKYNSLLREIKILSEIPLHKCIVGFVGACTEYLPLGETLLVFNLCNEGNLKTYLKDRQNIVSTKDLLKWTGHVTNGMYFLETLGVLHLNLSLKNILLDSGLNAKVSDFGLSRLTNEDVVSFECTELLNWRWAAPEILDRTVNHNITTKADVWSYGVLCWELFNYDSDDLPYESILNAQQLLNFLQLHGRLNKPEKIPDKLFELVLSTWIFESEERPNFEFLLRYFQSPFQKFVTNICLACLILEMQT